MIIGKNHTKEKYDMSGDIMKVTANPRRRVRRRIRVGSMNLKKRGTLGMYSNNTILTGAVYQNRVKICRCQNTNTIPVSMVIRSDRTKARKIFTFSS